jgi:hypothetical protein
MKVALLLFLYLPVTLYSQSLFTYDSKGNQVSVSPVAITPLGCVSTSSTNFSYDPKGNLSKASYNGINECATSPLAKSQPALSKVIPKTDTSAIMALDGVDFFRLFPNPSHGLVTIQFQLKQPGMAQLIINDMSGHTLQVIPASSTAVAPASYYYNAQHLAPGLYLCTLITPTGKWTIKWEKR